jgi:NRPS condensation-like uncharacterized protein
VLDCPDATALEALRTKLYTPPLPLDVSPGFRIALARRPDGDLILLSASHPVADGVGVVRLMQTIARLYRREPDPPDPLALAEARDLGSFLAPKTRTEKWSRELELLRQLQEALDPPSRIAVVGGAHRDGFGFVRLSHLTGDRFVDTAMLSNLGRLPAPPTFGSEPASEVWFSPPCDPTCSVSIGVVTSGKRLSLVTRYRHEQFDARAAAEFTDLLISQVRSQ